MCKTNHINFNEIKAGYVGPLLRNFPACGVRYRTIGNHTLVLVSPSIKDQVLVKSKVDAARISARDSICVAEIPRQIASVFGIGVPTLMDVVA